MNTEEELEPLKGRELLAVGIVPEYNCAMVFFGGATLAIKFEHGVMTWEVIEETLH